VSACRRIGVGVNVSAYRRVGVQRLPAPGSGSWLLAPGSWLLAPGSFTPATPELLTPELLLLYCVLSAKRVLKQRFYFFMTFGFLGFGKMASALVQGMLQAEVCRSEQILVVNRHPETIKEEVQRYGLSLASSPKRLVQQADTIVLGTKPADSVQLLREVRQDLDGKLLISVAAGITLQALQDAAGHRTRVIRAMPNTPSLVKKGATAYALGDHATAADAEVADKMFSAVGLVFRVRETSLNAVTGLSGSGPAYVFIFVEALADGGVMMGLPREIAFELAVQTVLGSAQMIRDTKLHPAELREMVASPGGTTMAGIETLEARGLRYTIMSAVRAASERARELGRDR
jgi:pyrroline-5-carboxylate reductase